MKILFLILSFTICFCKVSAQEFKCEKLKSDETTRQSYFSTVVFEEDKSFKLVRGVVELVGKPTDDVFVEVFALKNSKRIDGCRTGKNGEFSFPNLKKGSYILRLSKDGGFQLTEIKIKVSPDSKNTKKITGIIEIGY